MGGGGGGGRLEERAHVAGVDPANGVGVETVVDESLQEHRRDERQTVAAVLAQHPLEKQVVAEQQALADRDVYREGRQKLQRSMAELSAHAELAGLDRELAQGQLDTLLLQLQSAPANGTVPPLTPKDEQNACILERQRFIDMVEAEFQLHQAAIHLLRQTGGLEAWLSGAGTSTLTLKP